MTKYNVYTWNPGRLGNNMFEIAALKWFCKEHPEYSPNIIFAPDVSLAKLKQRYIDLTNIFDGINIIYNRPNVELLSQQFPNDTIYKAIPLKQTSYIYNGLRQTPKYWNNDREWAKSIFTPSDDIVNHIKEIYNDIDFENTVSIHIRRGDYVLPPWNENGWAKTITLTELNKALSLYNTEQKFIILSDDLKWCKENIKGDNIYYADRKYNDKYLPEFLDLYLQSLCKDNIISNSTFSWWGAYLNIHKDRKVYWFGPWYPNNVKVEIIPENDNWINLNAK